MDVTVHCNLRRLRKDRGYSLNQLSEIVGINKGNISRYEAQGESMRVETAIKFAIALGCTLDQLFTYEEKTSAGEV